MRKRIPTKKLLPLKKATTPPKPVPKTGLPIVKDSSFCIVGIGASAGGLEAFEQFFSAMPPDSNVGFVLVPHLDPTHTSMLPELLQRLTKMSVVQVRQGMKVAPNQIYVVPPNKDLEILQGTLCLSDPSTRQALRLPIDMFLRSLAADQGQKAVGIILSGSGSDGTLGLGAIKSEYGMTIVQDPNSAKFRGMPTSAIDAGIADFILPPAKMPTQLLAYSAHCTRKVMSGTSGWVERTGNALNPIFLVLRSQTGHDFSYYKRNTICRRIERRMNVHQILDVAQYTRYLKQNPQEVEMLFKELLIGVTSFFRDPEAFELLRSRIVAEILSDKSTDSGLRFWVPGCSTGEEVYSLAIILREALDEVQVNPKIQIFGTDIDSEAIDAARNGRYPANAVSGLSPERLKRFFVREGQTVRIKKEIREMALFAVQDVIKDPPFTRLDLICCRNLLIYLDGDLQKRLVPLFHYVLNPGGLLLLGSSETVGRYGDLFSPVDKKWKLFRRKDTGTTDQRWEFNSAKPRAADGGMQTDVDIRTGRQISVAVAEVAERALLDKYAPPCVIVNHKGDILYTHGRTGKFLELASGKASLNVYEMAREGLRLELNSALRRCNQQKKAVTLEGLQVKTNGGYEWLNLTVRPLREREDQLGMLTLVDATRIVNLIPSDIDRPLSHIASNLQQEDLTRDAQTVLETLIPKEVVVKTEDLRTFLMRMMPYRTVDNHIEGVVMTFTDIGAEHLLEAARDFAQGIVETVRQPLVVLDAQMRVLQANHAFYQTFTVNPKLTEQRVFFDLGNGQWNIPQLRALLPKILSENSRVQDFKVKHDFPGIGKRTMLVSARRIFHLGIGTDTVLLAIEDVSQARSPKRRQTREVES